MGLFVEFVFYSVLLKMIWKYVLLFVVIWYLKLFVKKEEVMLLLMVRREFFISFSFVIFLLCVRILLKIDFLFRNEDSDIEFEDMDREMCKLLIGIKMEKMYRDFNIMYFWKMMI